METFSMPLHEIEERFTKSEIYMLAWRSQEQHHHFKKKMKDVDKGNPRQPRHAEGGVSRHKYASGDEIPEGLPEKFYAQEVIRDSRINPKTGEGYVIATPGEINLSQVTGAEARRYMAAIGMPFPEIRNVIPKQ
jgi:hypothetical protein